MFSQYNSFAAQPAPLPTKDDMLGPGNTAPQTPPSPPPNMLGMGGSYRTAPLPLATVQQPGPVGMTRPPVSSAAAQGQFPSQSTGGSMFMPGGISRHPATRTGGIMTQSHPDFIGRRMSDMSGGVRPGQMPGMSAVQAARQAQAARGVQPQGQPPFMPPQR